MFNRLQNFKEQGYILVSIMEREDAIEVLKNVLKHFPQFDLSSGDYSKYSKQFECFFYKLAQAYPKIFLMEMYGIQTLWEYIQSYKRESLNGSINIYQAAFHIYEIIYYLYQSLPNFVSFDEMPTYKIEKKYAAALAAGVVKANTKKEIVKKTGSVILLAKDIVDGLNANSIKRYYKGTELSILSGISNVAESLDINI